MLPSVFHVLYDDMVCCTMLYISDLMCCSSGFFVFFFFQAEDGIRDLVRSRGLGDVYKRQIGCYAPHSRWVWTNTSGSSSWWSCGRTGRSRYWDCLLYTSDAADERSSVDLGGRRIIKKKNNVEIDELVSYDKNKEQRMKYTNEQEQQHNKDRRL